MDLRKEIKKISESAKESSRLLSSLSGKVKNEILSEMACALVKSKSFIMKANEKDLKAAKSKKLSLALTDRLLLNEKRIRGMVDSINSVITLNDPVGIINEFIKRPNGLLIGKMRVPIGVIGVVYESRPNVTADCIALCLKSGNALILRGGSEAINSNIAIFDVMNRAALKAGLPKNALNLIKITDRKAVDILLRNEPLPII